MNDENRYSVIIADTSPLVSEGLASLCEGFAGCSVVGRATDGAEAWLLIQQFSPDIALLDLHLGTLSTPEIMRRLQEEKRNTRVITLSPRGDRRVVIESLRAGASGFVLKSGTGRHLEEAVEDVRKGGIYVSPLVELHHVLQPSPRNSTDRLRSLSAREQQVFSMLVDGVRAKDIAMRLALSPKTVDTYRASLMRKLDIHDVPGLVKFAIQHNVTKLTA